MRILKHIILLSLSITISILFGKALSFNLLKTLAQSLASISSILFGVLGIWVGIMAPESLRLIYTSEEHQTRKEKWEELDFLFKPIFISLGVFSFSTIFIFIGEVLKAIPFLSPYTSYLRQAGTFILLELMSLTLYLLGLSLKPGLLMLSKSWQYIKISDQVDRLFSNKKK